MKQDTHTLIRTLEIYQGALTLLEPACPTDKKRKAARRCGELNGGEGGSGFVCVRNG